MPLPDAILKNPLTLLVIDRVIERRAKQLEKYPIEHDDEVEHDGSLAEAAVFLAVTERQYNTSAVGEAPQWAKDLREEHMDDRQAMLVDAAALIVAELERLERAERKEKGLGYLTVSGGVRPEDAEKFAAAWNQAGKSAVLVEKAATPGKAPAVLAGLEAYRVGNSMRNSYAPIAPTEADTLHFVCDRIPDAEGCTFIELEDAHGRGSGAGTWRMRPDGYAELVVLGAEDQRARTFAGEIRTLRAQCRFEIALDYLHGGDVVKAEAMIKRGISLLVVPEYEIPSKDGPRG